MFFWFRLNATIVLFLIFGGKAKKHKVFLAFLMGFWRKTKKTCVLLISVGKPKKPLSFFGFLLENQKTLGKPKNPKVSGPDKGFGFLVF